MTMRAQFVKTVTQIMEVREDVVLLLGDIGVHAFRDCFKRWPDRCHNVGVCEQSMVSFAAGIAKAGLYPIIHTIAPFMVERAFEQIKIDFGYQQLKGCFVSVGASYDYASLGCTHHCPGDVEILKTIPGMEVWLPWDDIDAGATLEDIIERKALGYVRLAEWEDNYGLRAYGEYETLYPLVNASIVSVGPTAHIAFKVWCIAPETIGFFHYAQVASFNNEKLGYLKNYSFNKILLVEPYYRGGLVREITEALWPTPVLIRCVGVDRKFLTKYGTRQEHDIANGLTVDNIRFELENLLNA